MENPEKPTKKQRRDAARAEREAAEAAAAAKDARKKRLSVLAGVVAVAAVIVAVVIGLTSSGGDNTPAPDSSAVAGVQDTSALLSGIPQSGRTLGNPKAPVTMIEFADLQCPICKQYSAQTLPQVIQDFVRDGKVKIELQLLTFLGPDSVRGAAIANAAARQDHMWDFVELFYANQGEEQSGYATDDFLRKIASAAPGLNASKAFGLRADASIVNANGAANTLASRYGVTGTPTLVVGPTDGTLNKVNGFDYGTLKGALDGAVKQAGATKKKPGT